ncbi:MAG: hypothetical protein A2355_18255, partial [Spirochaetes bacterium RIFOXYB1_FULL_32_8]
VLTRLADSYRKLGDYENSKKFYLKVFEIDPNNSYALTGIGYLFFENKKYDWALEYWMKMFELEPDNIRILTAIGNCHRKRKSFDEGIVFFENALKVQGKNFYALYGLADCYRGLAMHEESLHAWKELLDLSPNNKVIMTRLADAYRNLSYLDDAEKYYKEALDVDYDYYAILGLAFINIERKDYSKAINILKDAYNRDPGNNRSLYELALCYKESGDYAEGIKVLDKYISTGHVTPIVSELYNELKRRI